MEFRRSGELFTRQIKQLYRDCRVVARAAIFFFGATGVAIIVAAANGFRKWIPGILEFSLIPATLLFLSYPLEFIGIWFGYFLKMAPAEGWLGKIFQKPIDAAGRLSEGMRNLLQSAMRAYAVIILIGLLLTEVPIDFLHPVAMRLGLAETALGLLYLANKKTDGTNKKSRWKWVAYGFLVYYLCIAFFSGDRTAKAKAEIIGLGQTTQYRPYPQGNPQTFQTAVPANSMLLEKNLPCGIGVWPDLYGEKVAPRMEHEGITLSVQAKCRSEIILFPKEGVRYVWAEGSIPGTGVCFYDSLEQAIQSEEHVTDGNPCGTTESSDAGIVSVTDQGPGTDTHVEGRPAIAMRVLNPNGTGVRERIVFNNSHPEPLFNQ